MFYWLVKFVLKPVFLAMFRPRVIGAAHIPARGGALLASNHLSMSDSLFLPVLTRRRMTFLAKVEYFRGRGVKGRLVSAFVRGTGLVPVDRGDPRAAAAALRTAGEVLRTGRLLVVYPEGTRSADGRLHKGRTGVARLALGAGVPVVPVAMIGTDKVLPIGSRWPRPTPITIRIGAPLDFSHLRGRPVTATLLRSVTDEIMEAIASLSPQARSGVYAVPVRRH